MNLFVLVAVLCTNNGQCDYYALDSGLSLTDCDSYFTDSGVNQVDKLITDIIEFDIKQPLTLQSVECVAEDTN